MRFRILHATPGRLRLRAEVRAMTLEQADLLEAWIAALPGVERATVRERTCGVTVLYHGSEAKLRAALAGFSYEAAERTEPPLSHSSRAMNREYKEKLVFLVLRHYAKRLFLPAPIRQAISIVSSAPRILQAAKALLREGLTVDVLDGVAIGVSLLTGDHGTAGSVDFLLKLGELLDEWTHKRSVDDLARSMALQVDRIWLLSEDGTQTSVALSELRPGDRIVVHTGHVLPKFFAWAAAICFALTMLTGRRTRRK